MQKHCQSCGGPLEIVGANSKNEDLCQYCGDENGKLLPKAAVIEGLTNWLQSWALKKDGIDFKKRAEKYLEAMPAWN